MTLSRRAVGDLSLARLPARSGRDTHLSRRLPTRRTRTPLGLATLVALVVTASAPAAGAAEAPSGDFCADGSGVSVVVDFGTLEERVEQACVTDGAGQVASDVFESAGFDLTPVDPFPGAVCQIDALPADVPCGAMPAADAYWGLYVGAVDSEGAGQWDFAPVGADELEVSDGDVVGFAWQSGAEPAVPSVEPVAGEPAAEESTSESPSAAPDDEPSASAEPGPEVGGEDSGLVDGESGVAWWVPVIGLLALGGLALGITRARRGATGQDER